LTTLDGCLSAAEKKSHPKIMILTRVGINLSTAASPSLEGLHRNHCKSKRNIHAEWVCVVLKQFGNVQEARTKAQACDLD
jgi:hypothetical protein